LASTETAQLSDRVLERYRWNISQKVGGPQTHCMTSTVRHDAFRYLALTAGYSRNEEWGGSINSGNLDTNGNTANLN
jgi:hypothetical protein